MLHKQRLFLGTKVDNSSLVLFRMIFGFLAAAESFGAIMTGWVHETFIEPGFTFTMIGLEWLQPLEGNGMVYYYFAMGVLGLMIMLGLFYRASAFMFFGMWTVTYVMQKSHFNNHYYLLVLLSFVMFLLPAHKDLSLDARWGFTAHSNRCSRISYWFFIIQILIVYLFASIHKMHSDWVNALPIGVWFNSRSSYWLIGPLLAERWFQYAIAWGGILYDGTIVFLLLWRRTRMLGFILSIVFNVFNAAVFHIGIFPFLMIGFSLLFFPPESIRKFFFRSKEKIIPIREKLSIGWTWVLIVYFAIQVLLPLRHHLYPGSANWTEEGHRLAWRMMLRVKYGSVQFNIRNKTTGETSRVDLKNYVTKNQRRSLARQPDMIWQLAQRIKNEYLEKGEEVEIYVDTKISLNGRPYKKLIDPNVDLASLSWSIWKHSDWIITYEEHD